MSLFTSSEFASVCAYGTDWRDTSKNVLEQLERTDKDTQAYNFGFLYISDHLAEDATSIFNLFKSVLNIDNWIGSVGIGVIGCHHSYVNQPAISAMVGRLPEDSFCIFSQERDSFDTDTDYDEDTHLTSELRDQTEQWLKEHTPVLGIVHADPYDPHPMLQKLERETNSFLIGGLASSRSHHLHIANGVHHQGVSGALFQDSVQVSTTLSQGCTPISEIHTITRTDENIILSLNERRALDVLQDDLKSLAAQKLNQPLSRFASDLSRAESSDGIPEEFKPLFQNEVHVGLPLSQSDQKDYLVRDIIGIDADEGSISISDEAYAGDHLVFVERHPESVSCDLSSTLVKFRKRIETERGTFAPKAALYISCIARSSSPTDTPDSNEIKLIRDIIGDVPLSGFYASGEISNARIYGYTGLLTLFF